MGVERGCMSVVVGDGTVSERHVPLSLTGVTLRWTHTLRPDGNRVGVWKGSDSGATGWSLEAQGATSYAEDDTLEPAFAALRSLQEARTTLSVYVQRPNGQMLQGEGICTSIKEGGSYRGLLDGSYTVQGVGSLQPTGGPLFGFDASAALSTAADGDPVITMPNLFGGTDLAGTATARIGPNGPYLEFNGTSDQFSATFADLPDEEAPVSVVARVRLRPKTNSTLFASSGTPQYDLHFLDPQGFEFNMGGSEAGEIPFPFDEWVNVAAVVLPGRGRYYRVGGNQNFVFDPQNYVIPDSPLYVGGEAGTHYLNGDVRGLFVYKGALTHPMIDHVFNTL